MECSLLPPPGACFLQFATLPATPYSAPTGLGSPFCYLCGFHSIQNSIHICGTELSASRPRTSLHPYLKRTLYLCLPCTTFPVVGALPPPL